jgi:hypothetical protein
MKDSHSWESGGFLFVTLNVIVLSDFTTNSSLPYHNTHKEQEETPILHVKSLG